MLIMIRQIPILNFTRTITFHYIIILLQTSFVSVYTGCLKNGTVSSIQYISISRHNARLFSQKDQQQLQPEPGCNCQAGTDSCPAAGQCQKDNVIYRASVTENNGKTEYYTGLTANTFKEGY